jgi:hypothetical protein
MNDTDTSTKIDIMGSIWDSIKSIILNALGFGLCLIGILIIISIFTGSLILCVSAIGILGVYIGIAYREHPIIISLLLCFSAGYGAYLSMSSGYSFWTIPMVMVSLYGLLILPPIRSSPIDPLKFNDAKLYVLSILAFSLMVIGGISVSIGLFAALDDITKWTWVIPLFAFIGISFLYCGIIYSYRQKEYIIDCDEAEKRWENEVHNSMTREISKERNRIAKIKKRVRSRRFSKNTPTPSQIEKNRRRETRKNIIQELKDTIYPY